MDKIISSFIQNITIFTTSINCYFKVVKLAYKKLPNLFILLRILMLMKITSMEIIQNDKELTKKELNEWWKKSKDEIRKVDEDFKSIITDLLALKNCSISPRSLPNRTNIVLTRDEDYLRDNEPEGSMSTTDLTIFSTRSTALRVMKKSLLLVELRYISYFFLM